MFSPSCWAGLKPAHLPDILPDIRLEETVDTQTLRETIAQCDRAIAIFMAKNTDFNDPTFCALEELSREIMNPADRIAAQDHLRRSLHHVAGIYRTKEDALARLAESRPPRIEIEPLKPEPATEKGPSITGTYPESWRKSPAEQAALKARIEALQQQVETPAPVVEAPRRGLVRRKK